MKRLITRLALSCLICLPVFAASRIYIHTNDADWDSYISAAIVRMKLPAIVTQDAANADYFLESTVKPAPPGYLPSAPPRVHYEPHTTTVYSGQFVVPAANYSSVKFFTGNQVDQKLTVEFTASGGAGNDIQVVVMPARELPNWANGHATQVNYQTPGKLTTGKFTLTGLGINAEYAVVFENRFSVVTPKVVTAQIDLDFSIKVFDDPEPNAEQKMIPATELTDARTNEPIRGWLWTSLPPTGATPSWFQTSAETITKDLKLILEKRR